MLKIYGTMLCKDCVDCRADLDRAGVAYRFLDFGDSLQNLKEFLAIRDKESVFDVVKSDGRIGIPLVCREDGSYTFDWTEYVSQDKA